MCVKAVQVIFMPMLRNSDILMVKETLKDIFVGVTVPSTNYDDIRNGIQDKCASSNIVWTDKFIEKCIQL